MRPLKFFWKGSRLRMNEQTTSFVRIRDDLAAGKRVLILVRHAERPRINNEDPSFGDSLGLTAEGERTAHAFGQSLAHAVCDVQFRASPLQRTMRTAECIAKGMGIENASITPDAIVGNDCAFVVDQYQMWELFRDGSFFKAMGTYLTMGEQRGFREIHAAADRFEHDMLARFKGQLGIFVTHDLYIAAFLQAKGIKTDFNRETWPHFLDAAVLTEEGAEEWRLEFFRSGLSDGICGVEVQQA